jgi:hypothetical protein
MSGNALKIKYGTSVAIFVSGYIPLFFVLIIKDFNLEQLQYNNQIQVMIVWLLVVVSYVWLRVTLHCLRREDSRMMAYKIRKVKFKSSEIVNYTIPYMISFYSFDLSDLKNILSFVLFLSVLCYLSIMSHSVFFNPFVAGLGYNVYELDCDLS